MTIRGLPIRTPGWSYSFRVKGMAKGDPHYGAITWVVGFTVNDEGITKPVLTLQQPYYQRTHVVDILGIEEIIQLHKDLGTMLNEWERQTGSLP